MSFSLYFWLTFGDSADSGISWKCNSNEVCFYSAIWVWRSCQGFWGVSASFESTILFLSLKLCFLFKPGEKSWESETESTDYTDCRAVRSFGEDSRFLWLSYFASSPIWNFASRELDLELVPATYFIRIGLSISSIFSWTSFPTLLFVTVFLRV